MDAPSCSGAAHARAVPVLVVLALLTGCGDAEEPTTTGVAFCQSPVGDLSPSDTVEVEMRQGDDVVGTATAQVGTAVRFQVPADRRTDVYVDGALRGSAGEDDLDPDDGVEDAPGGWVYMWGEGCPEDVPAG